jgi:hypothetical protein
MLGVEVSQVNIMEVTVLSGLGFTAHVEADVYAELRA